jgi:hypothetical protein
MSRQNDDEYNDAKHQAKRIILAQVLAKDYSKIFLNSLYNNLSIESIIFKTIAEQSMISIGDTIGTHSNANRINDEILQLIGSEIDFLILSITIHNKINIKRTPF